MFYLLTKHFLLLNLHATYSMYMYITIFQQHGSISRNHALATPDSICNIAMPDSLQSNIKLNKKRNDSIYNNKNVCVCVYIYMHTHTYTHPHTYNSHTYTIPLSLNVTCWWQDVLPRHLFCTLHPLMCQFWKISVELNTAHGLLQNNLYFMLSSNNTHPKNLPVFRQ
jgi:hypothetical protein